MACPAIPATGLSSTLQRVRLAPTFHHQLTAATEHALHRRRWIERQNQRMLQQRLLQIIFWQRCYRASLAMHTDAASLSDFVTLLQSLETDELRHPLLAYLRLHIQSKPQKHEPELLHSTQWETTLL